MSSRLFTTVVAALCLALAGCGSIANRSASGDPSLVLAPGEHAVVLTANFGDPIGSLSTIGVADPAEVHTGLVTTDGSDALVRSFGGLLYVVNRFGSDSVQVIDPSDFTVIADYSVGGGSNPQDIVVSDEKAYVSRLDAQNNAANDDDVLVVDPLTGEALGSIDLTPFTADDGERLARAAQMVLVDGRLYVCMQDLPLNMLLPADTNGKVAVIDIATDEVVDVVELAGRNPSDIAYASATDEFFVASTGIDTNFVVDTADAFGGIEAFHRAGDRYEADGIVIDDAALGGGVAEVRIASAERGYTITNSTTVAAFNPTTREVVATDFYTSAFRWLPDIACDAQGKLWVAERDEADPGVVILDEDGAKVAGPIGVGAMPLSIAFVEVP